MTGRKWNASLKFPVPELMLSKTNFPDWNSLCICWCWTNWLRMVSPRLPSHLFPNKNRYMEWAICRFLRTKSIICRPMTFTSPARPNWCSIRCAPMKFFPKTTCRCSTPDSPPVFAAKQEPLAKIRAVWFASISF